MSLPFIRFLARKSSYKAYVSRRRLERSIRVLGIREDWHLRRERIKDAAGHGLFVHNVQRWHAIEQCAERFARGPDDGVDVNEDREIDYEGTQDQEDFESFENGTQEYEYQEHGSQAYDYQEHGSQEYEDQVYEDQETDVENDDQENEAPPGSQPIPARQDSTVRIVLGDITDAIVSAAAPDDEGVDRAPSPIPDFGSPYLLREDLASSPARCPVLLPRASEDGGVFDAEAASEEAGSQPRVS